MKTLKAKKEKKNEGGNEREIDCDNDERKMMKGAYKVRDEGEGGESDMTE